jgi:hypothetical protein
MKSPTGAMELTNTKRKVMVSVRTMRQQRQPTIRKEIITRVVSITKPRRIKPKKLSIALQQVGVLI